MSEQYKQNNPAIYSASEMENVLRLNEELVQENAELKEKKEYYEQGDDNYRRRRHSDLKITCQALREEIDMLRKNRKDLEKSINKYKLNILTNGYEVEVILISRLKAEMERISK